MLRLMSANAGNPTSKNSDLLGGGEGSDFLTAAASSTLTYKGPWTALVAIGAAGATITAIVTTKGDTADLLTVALGPGEQIFNVGEIKSVTVTGTVQLHRR